MDCLAHLGVRVLHAPYSTAICQFFSEDSTVPVAARTYCTKSCLGFPYFYSFIYPTRWVNPLTIKMRTLLLIVTVVLIILSTARLRLPHQKLLSRRLNSLVVPDQYLVVLRDDIADVQDTVDKLVELSPCSNVIFVYQITIKGFALADCSEDDLALLLTDPAVQYAVEVNPLRFTVSK